MSACLATSSERSSYYIIICIWSSLPSPLGLEDVRIFCFVSSINFQDMLANDYSVQSFQTPQNFSYTDSILPSIMYYCTFLPPSCEIYIL